MQGLDFRLPMMNRPFMRTAVLLFFIGLCNALLPAHAADETLVAAFLAKRQALVAEDRIDMGELSRAIRAAIEQGEQLERETQYGPALERLKQLNKYGTLSELPSFDVQMLSSWLYMKTGDSNLASAHRARAEAMRDILLHRIGSGRSPDDPVRAVMVSDIIEWARTQLAAISSLKSYPYNGHELMAVTYAGPTTGKQPAVAYFEIDPRVQAQFNRQQSLYAPIPLEQMRPEDRALFEQAKAKREAFLNDKTIPYLELLDKIRTSIAKASQLDSQGKPELALAALKDIETIRPIEDTPLPGLVGTYSFLQGKTGNRDKQHALRGLLFGINQVMAHSGDGLSPDTAVHVIATDEEYNWLADKRLSKVSQKILDTPSGKYDVINARNAAGEVRSYYFNITRLFMMYDQR
jgi:hypothetical protein